MSETADLFAPPEAAPQERPLDVATDRAPSDHPTALPASREPEPHETETLCARQPGGQFGPGNRAGSLPRTFDRKKRAKRKVLRDLAASDLETQPSAGELQMVAEATGLPESEFAGLTKLEVHTKVVNLRAMLGHIESFKEVHDRLDPKAQRHEHEHSVARPSAPVGDDETENEAAKAFFEDL